MVYCNLAGNLAFPNKLPNYGASNKSNRPRLLMKQTWSLTVFRACTVFRLLVVQN